MHFGVLTQKTEMLELKFLKIVWSLKKKAEGESRSVAGTRRNIGILKQGLRTHHGAGV